MTDEEFLSKFLQFSLITLAKKNQTHNFKLHKLSRTLKPVESEMQIQSYITSLASFIKKHDGFGSIYIEVTNSTRKVKALLVFDNNIERACLEGSMLLDNEFTRTELTKEVETIKSHTDEDWFVQGDRYKHFT